MKDFLMQLISASFQGGVIIAVVFALRLILKKSPKRILCLLWLLAFIRLLLPIQLESNLSLQPDIEIITQQESQQPGVIVEMPRLPAHAAPSTTIKTDDGQLLHVELFYSNEVIKPEHSITIDWAGLLPWLWLSVSAGLALWSILSYWKLRRKTKSAIILHDGVWLSPELDSAFVLGFLRPQIYLPTKLTEQERQLVIAHERSHIARFDHWYKLLGFATLCIHWFNPLVWLAYIFLCRDMEMACDEQVVKNMDTAQRKAYSMALLRCSADSHHFKPCPVAFAEVSVKDRIKGVLNYKKPGFWMTLVGIVAVVFVAVCFLTSPAGSDDQPPEEVENLLITYLDAMKEDMVEAASYHYFSNPTTAWAYKESKDYLTDYEILSWEKIGHDLWVAEVNLKCLSYDDWKFYYQFVGKIDGQYRVIYHYDIDETDDYSHGIDLSPYEQFDPDHMIPDKMLYENDIGIAPSHLFPFIYSEDTNYEFFRDIIGPNDCVPGYLYVYDERTEEITQLTDFPVLDMTETLEYIFYTTQDYQIIRTNYTGDSHEVIYKSVFGAIPKIEYGYGMLTFPDGHVAVVMDLNEGSRRFAYQMENLETVLHCAVGTNLVIRADGNFLGLDYITGKTCTFPSYQAMSDFLNQGIWPQSPEETAIRAAITQHFEFRKRILLEGVTEIPEMDPRLLRDELKHKKVLDAGPLKWTGSDYLITEITLNEKGYSEALVTETVYYEIEDDTLEDNTVDEVIVHIIRLSRDGGSFRVEEDAYREKITDFDSCTFSASKLEQTQKRIVREAIDQYFSKFQAQIFYYDATMIPEMHPLRLQDLLKHKKALDDAGIQQISSVYNIQEITLWDREYAEVTLTETATYKINGEPREAVIKHTIHLIGLETNCQVIDDGYYEPFSGFRSSSYVDPSELPD